MVEEEEKDIGFGKIRVPKKKRESAIRTAPQRVEQPQRQFEVPIQKPFEPTLEMDEDGKLIIPERPLTRDEKEQVTCVTYFKKHKENFDERILWYFKVETERELSHWASAFSPELRNVIKRLRAIEKRFGIKVSEIDRIGFDQELETEERG